MPKPKCQERNHNAKSEAPNQNFRYEEIQNINTEWSAFKVEMRGQAQELLFNSYLYVLINKLVLEKFLKRFSLKTNCYYKDYQVFSKAMPATTKPEQTHEHEVQYSVSYDA